MFTIFFFSQIDIIEPRSTSVSSKCSLVFNRQLFNLLDLDFLLQRINADADPSCHFDRIGRVSALV